MNDWTNRVVEEVGSSAQAERIHVVVVRLRKLQAVNTRIYTHSR